MRLNKNLQKAVMNIEITKVVVYFFFFSSIVTKENGVLLREELGKELKNRINYFTKKVVFSLLQFRFDRFHHKMKQEKIIMRIGF